MMNYFLKFGKIGDLIFTFIAIIYFILPLVLSYLFYWKSITIIPASILSLVSIIKGYKAINDNH